MANKNIISVDQFCQHYGIEVDFVNALLEYGLTEITVIENNRYIPGNRIKDIERMIRLHYDLEINMEGIEAISHLLDRMDSLQKELTLFKNRLLFYEHKAS
ncbi:MAG TPA: chaperone modulator CbpM [Saprospiraceae bacterium]|nr:chaperone modulator CbpM [Saprospiraceae bacterium]